MTYRYRVRNWADHFETHRTRDLDKLQWLMVPNKQHGMGFTRIMAQADGRTIFGVWYLIIEACSQQKAPRLGWLTDDGRADGRPWTIDDMAERWRATPPELARALDVLCSDRIAWIEVIESQQGDAGRARDDRGVIAGLSRDGRGSVSDVENSAGATTVVEASKDAAPIEEDEQDRVVTEVHLPGLQPRAGETRASAGETRGKREGREGKGEEQKGGDALAATANSSRGENRETVRTSLKELRLVASDSAVDDWTNFLTDAGCGTIEECVDCLHWVKRQARKDGIAVKWARHVDGYELRWKNRPRLATESA